MHARIREARRRAGGGGSGTIGSSSHDLSDETLLAGMVAGDQELSLAFVRRFQRRVFGVAFAVTGARDLADEVAQDAFERAWRRGDTFDARRGSVGAWLSTITRNLAIDAVRVRRPEPIDPAEVLTRMAAVWSEGPERAALVNEAADELRSALRRLPPEQSRAVVLASIGGLTASEVAAAEGIPLGTAKTRIRAAMGRLRIALEPGSPHD